MKTRLELSEHNRRIRDLMPVLVTILEKDIQDKAYGFVSYEETCERTIHVGKTESSAAKTDRGIVLRLVFNGKNYEEATNNLSEENLKSLAAQLNQKIQSIDEELTFPVYIPRTWQEENLESLCEESRRQLPEKQEASVPVHFTLPVEINPLGPKPAELFRKAREIKQLLTENDLQFSKKYNFTPLVLIAVNLRLKLQTYIFADRVKILSQLLPLSLAILNGQTSKGRTGRAVTGGMGGLEIIKTGKEEYKEVINVPHMLDNAEHLKPGNYPIITGPDITGVFAHEAFGHTQEGDTCRQDRSITSQFKNKKIGNDQATIINNAAVFSMGDRNFGTNGSYFFDQEGELARENIILDKGTLSPPMTDLLTSMYLGIRRTASGKRESWRRPTYSRQTNTYFSPGNKTLNELIKMVNGTGYLATIAHGGMEDPKGANLTAGAEYFEEIKDGKLTGRYFIGPKGGHIELSGFVPELLDGILGKSKINHESNEADIVEVPENKVGGCGKFHKEFVPAGCGGPYILWQKVNCG